MKHVDPTHLLPKYSTQQQIPNKLVHVPLQGISPTGQKPVNPEIPPPNVEYAPLDVRTRSWEVARNDVKVEKIIGEGAFGQVAAGTAKNLPLRSGTATVAIKMVKGKFYFFLTSHFHWFQFDHGQQFDYNRLSRNGRQNTMDCKIVIDFTVMFL